MTCLALQTYSLSEVDEQNDFDRTGVNLKVLPNGLIDKSDMILSNTEGKFSNSDIHKRWSKLENTLK